MPELPEVETIVRGGKKKMIDKVIESVDVKVPKIVGGDVGKFKEEVEHAKIENVRRFAKIIVLDLNNKNSLLVHLKLTGQLVLVSEGERGETEKNIGGHLSKIYEQPLPHNHTHVTFSFRDGSKLYFNDLMKFGYIKSVKTNDVENRPEIKNLGPEPLNGWTFEDLSSSLMKKKRSRIKLVLMDQKFVSGIGNIYANEILFFAKARPDRLVGTLSADEQKRIYDGIIFILKKAIEMGGSSENTYVDLDGKKGNFMDYAKVYQKKVCPSCKGPIKRVVIGGRGTFFCPKCQK
jgi:formamidopyrimidine-DNA glycosylase